MSFSSDAAHEARRDLGLPERGFIDRDKDWWAYAKRMEQMLKDEIVVEFGCAEHLRPGHFHWGVIDPPLRYKCEQCDQDATEFRYYKIPA